MKPRIPMMISSMNKHISNLDLSRFIMIADRGICNYKTVAELLSSGNGYTLSFCVWPLTQRAIRRTPSPLPSVMLLKRNSIFPSHWISSGTWRSCREMASGLPLKTVSYWREMKNWWRNSASNIRLPPRWEPSSIWRIKPVKNI